MVSMRRKPLRPKQSIFVREYLIDKNATRAAKAAGYSAKSAHSAGPRLLENVEVGAEIEKGLRKQERRLERKAIEIGLTRESWLSELWLIASTDFDDVARVVNSGLEIISTDERAAGIGRAIKKISCAQSGTSIELHSKMAALALIGKAQGWLKDRVEYSGNEQPVVIVQMPDNGRAALPIIDTGNPSFQS
jgi:phage terminase small subunit